VKDEQNKKGSGPERKRNEPRDTAPDAEQILPQMPEATAETAGEDMASEAGADPAAASGPAPTQPQAGIADKPANAGPAGDSATRPAAEKSGPGPVASPGAGGPVPPGKASAKGGGSGGKGLSGLALLIALAALGLSGWQYYQTQLAAPAEQEKTQLAEVTERQNAAQSRMQNLEQQLQQRAEAEEVQQLQRLAADLQRSQQALGQRLEALQGEAQADWKLAEAEYMLRLAGLRLLAAQDVRSAKELLRAADEILRDQPDSGVFAVREQLAQALAELETLPEIDRPGIYLRLAALHDQVNRIVALPVPVFDPDEITVEEEYEDRMARRTRAERVLMRLERYVRVDFQRGKVVAPLLDEAEMQRIRRTLQLTLEQAQWAALRGESQVYSASLARADAMLQQFFELDNPQVRSLQGQLALLAELQVAQQTPDLAPLQRSLAAYILSLRTSGASQIPMETGDE
jgi:uroporphyrin-III C-methyltransferase